MSRIDVGGFELRVAVEGAGAPPFVCLHGLVDSLEIWDGLAASLVSRGRVVRLDQRGHGESDAPPGPYRREDLAADVVALTKRLSLPPAILVGHSMGGVVAMQTALTHPEAVAGLVLLGTTSQCSERVAGWYERIARAGERDGTAGLVRSIYGEKSRRRVVGDARAIAHVTRTLATLHPDPLTPRLETLRCPVLLLVGERDPMGPRASEIIAKNLLDATLEQVPDCGHWLHVETPDVVIEAIDRWMGVNDL